MLSFSPLHVTKTKGSAATDGLYATVKKGEPQVCVTASLI
jgi:hypothetical protein